jgi:ATP-dependent helicase/nuclease subunit A
MLKSLIVAAPAGSGKTEELSRRYIDLLKEGVTPERILTLTFTEKAAAEMKERILKRLRQDHPDLYVKVRENILRLRISTIHAFCLSLLRRFAPHVGLDPALEGLEEAGAGALWNRALYDTLTRIAAEPHTSPDFRNLMTLVSRGKSMNWDELTKQFSTLYSKRVAVEHAVLAPAAEESFKAMRARLLSNPIGSEKIPNYSSLFPRTATADAVTRALEQLEEHSPTFLNPGGGPRRRGVPEEVRKWNEQMAAYRNVLLTLLDYDEFGRMLDLFRRRFLAAYDEYKRETGTVDFVDMEHQALKVISEDDHWQDILYAFDEQTDHLLVDEFQDTSYLQWAIILKLTEEWRAGKGAKADQGIEPTIFIVGDVKQSIYLFRDAKVEVFSEARKRLHDDLGDRVADKHIRYNYRSLQAIIDFTNAFFSKLMSAPVSDHSPTPAWRTTYEPFERRRKNEAPGRVEILLDRSDENMAPRRELEADMVARRILSLVQGRRSPAGPLAIFDGQPDGTEVARPCYYGDIAILMRKRTHLDILTDALSRHGIPFITVGGGGFFSEPEVCHLKSLLTFLVDPTDGFALYALLRGPLLSVPERELLLAASEETTGPRPRTLWDRLQAYATGHDRVTLDSERVTSTLGSAVARLRDWLGRVNRATLASILEQALSERQAWRVFWEPQRVANIRKFLSIIETMELEGQHPLRILEYLAGEPDEKRADVSVETSKAVQIMTIHGAKGLQFPVVFYVGADVCLRERDEDKLLIEEKGPALAWVSYIEKSTRRRENEFHAEFAQKEWEEEKRACYVACTRATDALFITGVWYKKRADTVLGWLEELLGLKEDGAGFNLEPSIPGICCLTAQDVRDMTETKDITGIRSRIPDCIPSPPRRHTAPITPEPGATIRAVTRNLAIDFQKFGEDSVGLGEVVHKLLEMISKGTLSASLDHSTTRPLGYLTSEIQRLLRLRGLDPSLSESIHSSLLALHSSPVWSVVKPQPDSFAELPVMFRDGDTIITGRIDRLIVSPDEVRIYDYKTFPVKKKDIPELARQYHDGQLRHYADPCRKLYPGKKVSTFLIFTALPEIVPTP